MRGKYRIGIDLGGTRIKTGLVKDGEVSKVKVLGVGSNRSLQALLPRLKEMIIELTKTDEAIRIESIGLAFPGIVDSDKNKVIDTSAKYTDAPSIDLVKWAKETFELPFRMDNDARLACLGEWRYGAGKGISNMVMLTLGTGIGTSAVVDGRLLRGKHFQASILGGHIIIDYKNKTDQCSCGKYGCPEAIASMWMIERKAKQHLLFKQSLLSETKSINWEIILKLSDQGDELSKILKQDCLEAWSAALINLVHGYDPEIVVVGGGISHTGEKIKLFFEKFLKERAWCPGEKPEIRMAEFPDTAALLGAAALFD